MSALPNLLLAGGGRMGAAMLAGWRRAGFRQAVVVDPAPAAASLAADNVRVVPAAEHIPPGFAPDAVVFAVKPQAAPASLPGYARYAGRTLFLSIMAGKSLPVMHRMLGADAAIIRAMPNTPAAIGQGFTVAVAGAHVTPAQRELGGQLLAAVGEVAWVEDEALLDAVTALSGGGPAYFFLLTELMQHAGERLGLPAGLARAMARKTFAGAAALLAAGEAEAADLRIAVTSPGGTTEAALQVLLGEQGLGPLLKEAAAAAERRSRELGK